MWNQRAERGFTLIELIITVAIIGILSAIAIPGYQRYMESTRRATGQADMLELAQFMERRYTNGYDYRESDGSAPTLPFTTAPRQGTPVYYNYSFDGNVERTKFKIQAVPAGPQTSDTCGTLTLDNTGTRDSASASGDCWQ